MNHNAINNALALIKSTEGCALRPYQDFGGNWTIGFGHKRLPNEPVRPITQEEADNYLHADFMRFVTFLGEKLPHLLDCEICALACLSFNVGTDWLKPTTNLGREVLAYDKNHFNTNIRYNIMYWMRQYNKAKNKDGRYVVLKGLIKRRNAEADFFNGKINFIKQTMY